MKRLREIIPGLLLLVFCLWANMGYAQKGKTDSVFLATDKMKELYRFEIVGPITNDNVFCTEKSNLSVDENQYCITDKPDEDVWVAALVKNQASGNQGDYTKYWAGNNKVTRNTWVFVPENFMNVCERKGITAITDTCDLSKRLCRLLGLSDLAQRDTIVYMKVPQNALFRPAYNLKPYKKLEANQKGEIKKTKKVLNYENIKSWMAEQQRNNNYPWTRMGYTYDWGDPSAWEHNGGDGYIGVSEFILKDGTEFKELGFVTIKNMTKVSWGDYNPPTK
jgi:hypothetical protein